MEDTYYNSGGAIYLRIGGAYIKRGLTGGWIGIDEAQLPNDVRWAPLQPEQLAAYKPALVEAGLIAK